MSIDSITVPIFTTHFDAYAALVTYRSAPANTIVLFILTGDSSLHLQSDLYWKIERAQGTNLFRAIRCGGSKGSKGTSMYDCTSTEGFDDGTPREADSMQSALQ